MSKLIAIEGIDGTGKTTQVELTVNELRKQGFKVASHSFPTRDHEIGQLIYDYFHGKVDMSPMALEYLHTADKVNQQDKIRELLKENDIVILDRYVTSQKVYSYCSKHPSKGIQSLNIAQDGLMLKSFDILLVLHPNEAKRRLEEQGRVEDRYENNIEFQVRAQRWFETLIPIGQRVDAYRPKEEIVKDIITLIKMAPDVVL